MAYQESQEIRDARRFRPARPLDGDAATRRLGMMLDLETTGVDPRRDQIIALAIVLFHYDGESRTVAAWEA